MSIITGCICKRCKRWHSQVVKYKGEYICVNCRREVEGYGEKRTNKFYY